MSIVLDSSATMAGIYADEISPAIQRVFELVAEEGAWVPSLWPLEVANILEMGVRRGRHNAAFRDATLGDLQLLPIHIDPETERQAWGATLKLAERHGLALYDAAYLELAKRLLLPLATLDGDLRRAAEAENATLLG
ncbi:MAG: type II toxin-antitoxin system VapC family toxin [Candidatus Acidiferrales bacterium]